MINYIENDKPKFIARIIDDVVDPNVTEGVVNRLRAIKINATTERQEIKTETGPAEVVIVTFSDLDAKRKFIDIMNVATQQNGIIAPLKAVDEYIAKDI